MILTDSTRILRYVQYINAYLTDYISYMLFTIYRNGEKTEDASAMLVYLNIKAMCKADIDVFVEFVHMDNMKFMSEDASAINKNMKGVF